MNPFKLLSSCPLCNSTKNKKLYKLKFTNVFQCKDCGFKFLNPCLDEEAMKSVYLESDKLSDFEEYHEGYYEYDCLREGSRTRKDYELVLKQLNNLIPNHSEKFIYEIGYGHGSFLALARQKGW